MDNVVLLDVMEQTIVVVFDFAQFKEVLGCNRTILGEQIDYNIPKGGLKQNRHSRLASSELIKRRSVNLSSIPGEMGKANSWSKNTASKEEGKQFGSLSAYLLCGVSENERFWITWLLKSSGESFKQEA